jgi:hypothetical protein
MILKAKQPAAAKGDIGNRSIENLHEGSERNSRCNQPGVGLGPPSFADTNL